jgi:hypothetical protein
MMKAIGAALAAPVAAIIESEKTRRRANGD